MYIYIHIILKINTKIHTIGVVMCNDFPILIYLDICIPAGYYDVRDILSKYITAHK